MPALLVGLGISTSAAPGADPVADAVHAEALGFDFVSASDHPAGTDPSYETATLLAWIAARTRTIMVASRVFGVPFRNPAVLAKAAETLQRLSAGRLILGLGGGYSDAEIHALGAGTLTPRDKVDGLADAIAILHGTWTEPGFTHHGQLHSVTDLDIEPKPDLAPPIWLGSYGNRALALTGRAADGWIPSLGFAPPDRIPAMRGRIEDAAAAADRKPGAVRYVYNVPVRVDTRAAAEPDLVTGAAADVVEQLIGFTDLGFTGFNIVVAGDDTDHQVRAIADDVLPALHER